MDDGWGTRRDSREDPGSRVQLGARNQKLREANKSESKRHLQISWSKTGEEGSGKSNRKNPTLTGKSKGLLQASSCQVITNTS